MKMARRTRGWLWGAGRGLLFLSLSWVLASCDTSLEGGGAESTDATSSVSGDVGGETSGVSSTVGGVVNDCGGEGALRWRGVVSEPLTPCGAFEEGVLVCDGAAALRCIGEAAVNACGGSGVLPVVPGEACGCGGVWACSGGGGVACLGSSTRNACGGCDALAGWPGDACDGGAGTLVCDGGEALVCLAGARNGCGGSEELVHEGVAAGPGAPCASACGAGVLVCDGEEALACVPEGGVADPNECGGCGLLPGRAGEACGACGDGAWACGALGTMRCSGDRVPDFCGGCTGLEARPGERCEGGEWRCAATSLLCVDRLPEEPPNACGGVQELVAEPGEACGECGLGLWTCDGVDGVRCAGDRVDACGGCGGLEGSPGEVCGSCGTGVLACDPDGSGALFCSGDEGEDARNACGGCGALVADPGASCGTCAVWACSGERLRCAPAPDLPGCGPDADPCGDLDCAAEGRRCTAGPEPGVAGCDACLPGFVEHGGRCVPDAAVCDGDAGCAPGFVCGDARDGDERRCAPAPEWGDTAVSSFVRIPGTRHAVRLGSPPQEPFREASSEEPVDGVLVRDFWMAEVPLTEAAWEGAMQAHNQRFGTSFGLRPAGSSPAAECTGLDCPVVRVNWWEALQFANAVSALDGLEPCYVLEDCTAGSAVEAGAGCAQGAEDCGTLTFQCEAVERRPACTGYRLPTEAEWERAVRADVDEATWLGTLSSRDCERALEMLGDAAFFECNAGDGRRPVGDVEANPLGVRDMLGNVWEWTWDAFADAREGGPDPAGPQWPAERAVRGGSYRSSSSDLRASRRRGVDPLQRERDIGLRLVRSVPSGDDVRCPSLAQPPFTFVEEEGTRPGDRGFGTCFLGWPIGGDALRICAADGVWTGEDVACAPSPGACGSDGECPAGMACATDAEVPLCAPRPSLAPGVDLPFVTIPSGGVRTLVGSPPDEVRRDRDREDQVEVGFTRHLWMQPTPMTVAQWRAVVRAWNDAQDADWPELPAGVDRRGCGADDCPITFVNVHDIALFANALSELHGFEPCYVLDECVPAFGTREPLTGCTGPFPGLCSLDVFRCDVLTFAGPACTGYRLPTEAEWETAVRAGTTTARWNGDATGTLACSDVDESLWSIAWFTCNSNENAQPVGQLEPNPWGLHDMFGNVMEWTWNIFAPEHDAGIDPVGPPPEADGETNVRVLRGGSAQSRREVIRAAARFPQQDTGRAHLRGFRLVRSIGPDDVE
ncbi:MAG: hypothetical protein EA398_01945 [Deltaproteobacteria bacterium]|nr:MAG: hypothetical protein EA398_01945 [Deltaproteobacteria bacterium]